MIYTVSMKSHGNPEYGQTEPQSRPSTIQVPTIEDAQKVVRIYIEAHNLGGGNFSRAEVRDESGALVGTISYNGRFWKGESKLPEQSQRSKDATRELLAAFEQGDDPTAVMSRMIEAGF